MTPSFSDNDPVSRALAAGTPPAMICAACTWDRLCVAPPSMSTQRVDEEIARVDQESRGHNSEVRLSAVMVTVLTLGERATSGKMCPVFALRLRTDRSLADHIRFTMQNYQEKA